MSYLPAFKKFKSYWTYTYIYNYIHIYLQIHENTYIILYWHWSVLEYIEVVETHLLPEIPLVSKLFTWVFTKAKNLWDKDITHTNGECCTESSHDHSPANAQQTRFQSCSVILLCLQMLAAVHKEQRSHTCAFLLAKPWKSLKSSRAESLDCLFVYGHTEIRGHFFDGLLARAFSFLLPKKNVQ